MTIKELFIWACEHHAEDKKLYVECRDSGGSYHEFDADLQPSEGTVDGAEAVII